MTRCSIPYCARSLPENHTKHGCRQREKQQLFLNICFISQILSDNIYRISYKGGAGCGHQGKLDLQADSRIRKPTSELHVQSKHGPTVCRWEYIGREADGGDGKARHVVPRCHHYRNCPSTHGRHRTKRRNSHRLQRCRRKSSVMRNRISWELYQWLGITARK